MRKSNLLRGDHPDIVDANIKTLKDAGYSHASATKCAMCVANSKHSTKVKKISKMMRKVSPIGVTVKPGAF